jgi:hypothetical protein
MKEEKVFGTEINTDEFLEEYNNRSDVDDENVEVIDLETRETKTLSEEEFKEFLKEEKEE